MPHETNQQSLPGASSVQESVRRIQLSIPILSLQILLALNRGELILELLIVFRQHSVLRFLRGPYQVTRALRTPACASCGLNNLATSDLKHVRYEDCQ